MIKKLYLLYVFMICSHSLFSQSLFVSDGGEIKNNNGSTNGSVSYTVGQFTTEYSKTSKGSITVGIQQGSENEKYLSVKDSKLAETTVYPNPTVDYLVIDNQEATSGNFSYTFYSINGLLLEDKKITATKTLIDIKKYSKSLYILQLFKDGQPIQSFKIIKN